MLIGKKVLEEENVVKLISDIKKKKELQEISDDFVRDNLFRFFQQETKLFNRLVKGFSPKSSSYKEVIKKVRAKLRRVYGLFRIEEQAKKRKKLVEYLLKAPQLKRKEIIKKILATHSSTKERLSSYPKLYKKIFRITGKPKAILDLGCGINPFSILFMGLKELVYYAHDISEEEVELLNRFFKLLNSENGYFIGKAEVLNLIRWARLKELEKAEVCFLFKMTDVLDQGKGHKVSEAVIRNVPAKFVVVSFPTLTMSGKKMRYPRRGWIELMCRRLGYSFKLLEFGNELFYVLEKHAQ